MPIITEKELRPDYDVIVVGSGAGAGGDASQPLPGSGRAGSLGVMTACAACETAFMSGEFRAVEAPNTGAAPSATAA
jgi:hypothetical protein